MKYSPILYSNGSAIESFLSIVSITLFLSTKSAPSDSTIAGKSSDQFNASSRNIYLNKVSMTYSKRRITIFLVISDALRVIYY